MPSLGGKSDSRAGPPAYVSRQPRLLQRHIGPFSSIVTCPIWPALPLTPRKRSPPTISPALMVWPTRMNTDEEALRRAALARLGEPGQVRLAVDEDRTADARRQALGDVDALPAAQEPGGRDHAGARIDGGGQGESDGEEVADRAAERLHHVAEQDAEPVELGVVTVVEREGERGLRDDRAGRVGDRDVQLPRAEVHAGHEAELAGQRDECRAPAAARGDRGVQQSGGGELLDDVRHRRGRQAGASGQLDLRQSPMPFERLDEPGSVGFTK